MFYFTSPGRFLPGESNAESWGDWTMYVHVGDDQYALQQLNLFENGNVLCYDAVHSCDKYGYLVGLRFSKKPKWRKFFPDAKIITESEFNTVWKESDNSSSWVNR